MLFCTEKLNQKMAARVAAVFGALCLMFSSGGAVAAHAAETFTVSIPYTQVWTTNVSGVNDVFYYEMTPASPTPDAPLPEAKTGSYVFSVKGNASGSLGITYTHAGFYYYTVKAKVDHPVAGYTYEPNTYTVTVCVANPDVAGSTNSVLISNGSGKLTKLALDPKYYRKPTPTPTPTTVTATGGTVTNTTVNVNVSSSTRVPQTSDSFPYEWELGCWWLSGALCLWFLALRVREGKRMAQERQRFGL